jgi:hypothetical protein
MLPALFLYRSIRIIPSVDSDGQKLRRCSLPMHANEASVNPVVLPVTRKLVTSKFANWALCLRYIGLLGMEIQLRRKSAS